MDLLFNFNPFYQITMADKNNFYEELDDFIFGRLEAAKEKNFREALKTDSELAKAVSLRKDLHDGMKEGGRRTLKKELGGIYKELYEPQKEAKVKKMIPWRQLLLVASMVLFGLFAWWFWPQAAQSLDPILAEHYQPFNLVLAQRGKPADKEINQAAQLYHSKNYKAAIPILENALKDSANEDLHAQLRLALAIARFENGDTEKAFQPLHQIIESNDLFLSDQARWYLSLFHLQLDQNESAIPYLEFLANKNGADKNAEAKGILKQLK